MKKSRIITLSSLICIFILCLTLSACITNVDQFSSEEPDTVAPVITVEGESEYLIPFGSIFTLPKITALDDKESELTHDIKVYCEGEEVALENYSFVAEKAGVHTVEITVKDSAGNQSQETITVNVTGENEINTFDDQLRIDNVSTKGFTDISLNTDPAYVRYGEGSLKLEVSEHVSTGWPGIVVNNLPISDISGYYSVSFWIFNDGTDDITLFLHRNEIDASAKFEVIAKAWTKIEVIGRKYDNVFTAMQGDGAEPEVGGCEDLKCFTFHFTNPANTPTFNIYVDHLVVNTEAVYDTLEIEADVIHPVKGVAYDMPATEVYYGGEKVEASVTYTIYDKDYNKIEFDGNSHVFENTGKYVLSISADYNGLIGTRNYMIVCANARAENEIEFFESEDCLNFFTSPHLTVSYSTEQHHSANGSTGSLKIHSSPSVWPYVVMNDLPHADLENVAYIYLYAKTDYALKEGQKAYLGLRDGGRGKVLSRLSLSNDWQCFAFTKDQLANLGVTTLNGLQFSVELYDLSNPVNQGGWCPVAFDTYIDNFSIGAVAEPTEKEEGVVLDFANYRDLDDITSSYVTFNFSDLDKTLNNLGSMKVSAAAKWPEMHFGSSFAKYSLEGVKNLVIETFVPVVEEGHYVRVGAFDSGYQKVYAEDAGKWVSLYIPIEALQKGGTGTLEGLELNVARWNGSTWINLDDVYFGKIWLDYEGKPQPEPEKIEFTGAETQADLNMFRVENSLYEWALNDNAQFVKEGNCSIRLYAEPRWPRYYFTQQFIDWLAEKGYESFTFEMYISDANNTAKVTQTEGLIYSASPVCNEWVTVTVIVANLTASSYIQFNKSASEIISVYIDNFIFNLPEQPEEPTPEQPEGNGIVCDFSKAEHSAVILHQGGNVGEVVEFEGSNAVKFVLTSGAWSKMNLFADIDEMVDVASVNYLYLDLYVDVDFANAGDYIRFTYYVWNGSSYSEKFVDGMIKPNEWTTVRIPILAGTAKLSDVNFLFPLSRVDGGWGSIGQRAGEALYVREVGVISNAVALRDFTGAESDADLAMFYVKNEEYRVMLNSNEAYVKEGEYSIRLCAEPRWPQFYLTEGFINWLKQNGYVSFTFDIYVDGTSGVALSGAEGINAGFAKVNEWQTVTVTVDSLVLDSSRIQINKGASGKMDIYIDNVVFNK